MIASTLKSASLRIMCSTARVQREEHSQNSRMAYLILEEDKPHGMATTAANGEVFPVITLVGMLSNSILKTQTMILQIH